MTQVNERENEVISGQEVDSFLVKAYKNGTEFIYPGKSAFANETTFVNFSIEQALPTTLRGLTIAEYFCDVWDKLKMVFEQVGVIVIASHNLC